MIATIQANLPDDIQFYQQILDLNPSSTILVDAQHTDTNMPIVYVNQAFESMTGYRYEEVIGKNPRFLHADDPHQDDLYVLRDAIRDQKACTVVLYNYHKNGQRFRNELHITPLRNQSGQVTHFLGIQNDVTRWEQHKSEQAEAYRILVNEAMYGMMIFQDSRPVFVNQTLVEMLGYSREAYLASSSDDFWEKIHPDDRATVQTRYRERIEGKPVSQRYTYRMLHKNGYVIWIEALVNYVDYKDKPSVQVVMEDVTEHKQMLDTLRLYQAAVESSDDLIMVVDRQYRYILVNNVYLNYHQLSRADVMGKHVSLTVGNDIFQSVLKLHLDRSFAGEMQQFEMDFHYPALGKRHPWVKLYPLYDGVEQIVGVVVMTRDITERKQVEMQLLESEARARALLEAIPDRIFRLDHEGNYLDYKSDLNELDEQHVWIGKNIAGSLPPEFTQLVMGNINKTLETGKLQVFEYQQPLVQTLQDYEARMVMSGQDEVTVIVRNITEHNRIRQREFHVALEHARVQLLIEFIENASHEFRTPLTTISINSHMIRHTTDVDVRLRRVDLIQNQVQRITKLVNMLLRMVELETTVVSLLTVNISELIQEVCQDFSVQFRASKIDCKIEPNIIIPGNETLLREAIQALMDNAFRFGTEDGSVKLLITQSDEHISISIQDEGPGIAPEKQPYIFDTFWREDRAHSSPGFGLGLAIARKVAQIHHGNIVVQSAVGQGSTFSIILPTT